MKSSSVIMSLSVLLFCFVSFGYSRDYTIEVNPEFPTNTIVVDKNSAFSAYNGKVTYAVEGPEACSWTFCITRNFRGVLTEHDPEGGEDMERILSDQEGCLLVNEANITTGCEDETSCSRSLLIESFAWNAQGQFYLNGQLTSGNCSASLTVSGSECEERGRFGFGCEGVGAFPVPKDNVELEPTADFPSLAFAGLTSTFNGKSLGQLKMVMEVVDMDSDGIIPTGDLGFVRLLLNGIPTENDYDLQVPLLAPSTELSLAAARRDSDYFYSVQATENVTVFVEPIEVMVCSSDAGATYGPNCSITALSLTTEMVGDTQTINPKTATFCFDNGFAEYYCYFYLVLSTLEVTVMPTPGDDISVLYKTNNFPTSIDYDVAMPAGTSFTPDFSQTPSTTQLVVFSPTGNTFTIELGQGSTPPPPPHDDDDDDDLPWAWIGVSIALGVIALALVTGFAIYTCKPNRTYISVE